MADREIRLVGVFQDGITPKLTKLNRSIDQVTKSFAKMQAKLRPIAREMGVLAMASERVAKAMRTQRSAMESSIRVMRQYRTETGALNRSNRSVTASINTQRASIGSSVRAMNQYRTAVGRVVAAQKKLKTTVIPPATALPRQARPYSPAPRGVGGGGGGGGLEAGVFGVTLGNTLSGVMTNAIVRGFQLGVSIMQKPFQFIRSGLAERVQDEMSDVRAAGGLFSISRRMEGGGFVRSFAEAENLTKETNRYLAELAGALPGDTQEYINVSKQIADGIFTIVAQDKDNALKLGKQLAVERGESLKVFEQGGQKAMQAAGKEIIGEMTKLTVLAGLGGRESAFGLPQLTEQMLAKDEVTMGMFTRYAAIFRDPMIKGALERNMAEINKAGVNTTARLEAIRNAFQEIVTPELVRRYQRTTAGVLEALRTTFLNPEVGLLGLGRPLNFMSKTFNEFGQVVRENGKVVEESLSVFDFLRDIFANLMIVLQPVIEAATKLFDPFTELGKRLDRIREATMMFQNSFERYRLGLEDIAKGLKGEQKNTFQATLTLRAALAAINNAFANLGVYGEAEFQKIAAVIKDPAKGFGDFAKIIQDMVSKFLSSEGAAKIGEAIGGIIGTVVSTVGQLMAQLSGLATGGKLAEGFARGFREAGGVDGFRNIIKGVFHLFGKLLLEVFKAAPLEISILSSLALFGPAIAAAIGTAIVGAIPNALGNLTSKRLPIGPGRFAGRPQAIARGAGRATAVASAKAGSQFGGGVSKVGPAVVSGIKGIKSAFAYGIQEIRVAFNLFKMGLLGPINALKALAAPFRVFSQGFKGFGQLLSNGAKGLGKFGGAITAIVAAFNIFSGLLSGKDIWESLGQAAGPVIGTLIGTALLGPIGGVIGGFIGSLEPVTSFFEGVFVGLGDALGPIGESLAEIGHTLWLNLSEMWGVVTNIIPGLKGLGGEFDALRVGITTIKILLFPLTATLDLINVALQGLRIGFLYLQKWIAGIPGIGRLAGDQAEIQQKINDAQTKFGETLRKNNEKYSWDEFTGANIASARAARQASTSSAPSPALGVEQSGQMEAIGFDLYMEASPIPAIQALSTKQAEANAMLAQINAKILPQQQVNPIPQLQTIGTGLSGASALIAQVKAQIATSGKEVKAQVGASSNNMQTKIEGTTAAVNSLSNKFTAGMPVRIVGTPTVKFDMGGMGPVGGGIGGFPKTSGYGMRWGKMHQGNDYAMPVGTKLGIGGPGKVLGAGYWGGYGNAMDIGGPGGMVYRFAHLSKFLAPVGANLPPGMPFALSGNTGRSTGPHLHFEARPGGAGPVNPDAFAGIIRANFAGTALGPLMGAMGTEMKNMPYGAQLAVANSDEIFMKPKQMAHVIESSARAGAEGTGNITTGPITINVDGYDKDPRELTEIIASQLVTAMYRQSRSEVLTS